MIKYIIGFLILLSVSVYPSTHTVTSLPYTFTTADKTDTWDTLVISGTKLSSVTGGITLTNTALTSGISEIVIDLQGDTIEFGTAGGNGNVGITLTGVNSLRTSRPNNIKVVNGWIIHNPSDTTASDNFCVSNTGYNTVFDSVYMVTAGYDSKAYVSVSPFNWMQEIARCSTFTNSVSFNSRCNYDCVMIYYTTYGDSLDAYGTASDTAHIYIHDTYIDTTIWMGISVQGIGGNAYPGRAPIALIFNNTITVDARNDLYSTYSGTCLSAANPYGIGVTNIRGGSWIYGNTIRGGTSYGGNRGILVEGAEATQGNPVYIRQNNITVHNGPSVEYAGTSYTSAAPCGGIRIRNAHNSDILVDSNTISGFADTLTSTTHIGKKLQLIHISEGQTIQDTLALVKNNTITATANSDGIYECAAVTIDAVSYDSVVFLSNNNITSSQTVYQVSTSDAGAGYGQVFVGDTVSTTGTSYSPQTFELGLGNYTALNNIARDIVFNGATAYNDITFGVSGSQSIFLQRGVSVVVSGSNTFPVSGASVNLVNDYGDTLGTGTTDGNGSVSGIIANYYFDTRSGTDTASASYNDFILTAYKGSDTIADTFTIGAATDVSRTVTLSATAGTVPQYRAVYGSGRFRGVR